MFDKQIYLCYAENRFIKLSVQTQKGQNMRYTYNDVQGLINGVIFYFEPGDDEITRHTFNFLADQNEAPTSIVWDGTSVTMYKALCLMR